MPAAVKEKRRITTLLALIIAGEAVFFLPFVMARIFRPTLLEVFGISNTELGAYFSAYGIVAMISYLFGGILADRYPARNLMAAALFLTSLGGFIMVSIPGAGIMTTIYAFWGFTSIFLFWAAMIRATREWGGEDFQGRAFGWLEGGRGGTAAIVGTIAFFIFYWFTPESTTPQDNVHSTEQGLHAFQIVIIAISVFTFLSGVMVWFLVPVTSSSNTASAQPGGKSSVFSAARVIRLIKLPTVWMLSIMIVCAYVGYKITDDFSLYAREVLGFSEVSSAGIGTAALWVRAIVAILAGYTADRLNPTRVIMACFAITVLSGSLTASGVLSPVVGLVLLNMSLTAIGIYAVRALYFAILKQANIPLGFTGTAVGIVSLVGYTPDVFMSPWMGYLLDKYPGNTGHQYVFLVLSGFALVGFMTCILFNIKINMDSPKNEMAL